MAGPRSRRQPIRNSSTSTCHDFLVGSGSCDTKGTRPYLVQSDKTLSDIVQLNPHEAGGGSFQQQGMLYYRIQRQGSPIGVGMGLHIFSTLFCEFVLILPHPFSTVATTSHLTPSQLVSVHLSSSRFLSQLFSTARVFSSFGTSAQLFSPLPISCQLFSPLPTSSQLISPLRTSSELFSTQLNSTHILPTPLNSFHLFPPLSILLNDSHLLPPVLNSSCLLSPLPNSSTHKKILHTANFYTKKFLHTGHTEAFRHTLDKNGSSNRSVRN